MLKTRLTEKLNIEVPILLAPMAFASGGALAAAVTQAGGLGFIGGGYGDKDWLLREFKAAGNAAVGCGFITWSLANQPELLTQALDRSPKAIFLSFGDPAPFVGQIKDAGAMLICQVQTLRDAKHVIDIGADIVVAQGLKRVGMARNARPSPWCQRLQIISRQPRLMYCWWPRAALRMGVGWRQV